MYKTGGKDHIRDYATEAFRFYKSTGGAEPYKNKLRDDSLIRSEKTGKSGGISKPTEAQVIRAQNAVDEAVAAIADLEAVARTLDILGGMRNGREILAAVRIVYFTEAEKPLSKGDISIRVHKASLHIPLGERSVYRYLLKARIIFAIERGLRL